MTFVATDTKLRSNEMKALNLLKTLLENGISSYNEEDDTVLVNGWWVTLEECIVELEALQQPKRCDGCGYGKITINSVICGKNGTYKEADDYCKYFKSKEQ